MYPITSAVKALFDAEQRQTLRITGTDKNGNPVTITDANVMAGGFTIDRYACNSQKLEVGTAISAEMTLNIDNRQGQYDGVVFEGTELKVEIGIADWSQENPTRYYIPCGYFTPDTQPRALSTISIHALDRMMLFEKVVEPAGEVYNWVDHSGNKITDASGNPIVFYPPVSVFPCTLESLVSQVCDTCGVELAESISSLPNAGYSVIGIPDILGDVTYRNLIQWAAGLMGTNAYIDWDGKLRFAWFDQSTNNWITTTANRYASDLYENDLTISGVVFTDMGNTLHTAGDTNYALDLTGNYLIDADTADTALSAINTARHAYTYRPFNATVVAAPYLWPMDRMQFEDKDGNIHISALTNVNFTVNGSTAIEGKGETDILNKYAIPGAFTKRQQDAMQRVQVATENHLNEAVYDATQQITGNKGGYIRFMYDENNNPYEMLIMDDPIAANAVNVWRWNQAGLGHSSNGYEGPFDDIAITQSGSIVANYITSGTLDASIVTVDNLDADNITSGHISSALIDTNTISISQMTNAAQAALVGSVTTKPQYYLSTSASSATGGSWQDTVPSWSAGKYIWTRIATTKTMADGTTTSTTYSTEVYDENLTNLLSGAGTVNLLPSTYSRENSSGKTWNTGSGITFTLNADGSITATGTATGDVNYQLTGATLTAAVPVITLDTTKKYTLSGCPGTGSNTTYRIGMRCTMPGTTPSSSSGTYYGDTGSSVTTTTGYKYAYVYINIYSGYSCPQAGLTFYPQLEVGEDAHAYVSTHNGSGAVSDRTRTAQTTANGANAREQYIYKSAVSGTTTMAANTTWVTDATGAQETWTTRRPEYNSSKPVLFVALQSQTVSQKSAGSTCTCSTPVIDQTTTVIDGGHITTGTIDAGVVNVTNINANNITSGTIDASRITVTGIDADNITGGTIDGDRVEAQELKIKDSNGNVVATFDSTIKIGRPTLGHSETDYNSYSLFDKNNDMYLEIGDNRDANGRATVENVFYGDGSTVTFDLSNFVYSVTSVYVNNTEVPSTGYYIEPLRPIDHDQLTFNSAPADKAYIVVTYQTEDSAYHNDFGVRATNSCIGAYSSTSGINNTASGNTSRAEGVDNTAAGTYSYSAGKGCTATGLCSRAEGYECSASAPYSHAMGYKSIAYRDGMTAIGFLNSTSADSIGDNDPHFKYLFVIGNGENYNRSNAMAVNQGGDIYIPGYLYDESDERRKTECGEVPDVSNVRARRFKWNDKKPVRDSLDHIGYFAQDVEKVAPYLVQTNGDGWKSLDYIGFLCAKVESLEKRVTELEARIKEMTDNG